MSKNGLSSVRKRTIRHIFDAPKKDGRSHLMRSKAARERLVATHLPLIRFIVHRMASRLPRFVEAGDLINTGVVGLFDAASRFDSSRRVQFKTFAELRIRGAILDSLRQMDWAPRSLRRKGRLMEETREKLSHQFGRNAEDQEMARAMGMNLSEYQRAADQVRSLSLGQFHVVGSHENGDGEPTDVLEFVPADDAYSPHIICEKSEMRRRLAQIIDTLPKKERLVVALYYYEELSMKQIGCVLKVNESRVSQIMQKALFLLRRRLKNRIPEIRAA